MNLITQLLIISLIAIHSSAYDGTLGESILVIKIIAYNIKLHSR